MELTLSPVDSRLRLMEVVRRHVRDCPSSDGESDDQAEQSSAQPHEVCDVTHVIH